MDPVQSPGLMTRVVAGHSWWFRFGESRWIGLGKEGRGMDMDMGMTHVHEVDSGDGCSGCNFDFSGSLSDVWAGW